MPCWDWYDRSLFQTIFDRSPYGGFTRKGILEPVPGNHEYKTTDAAGYGAASEDLPYLALNESHLARWRGNCLVMFGDPQTADDLAAALAAMDDGFTRAEAGLRCDLAAALHVRGEHDEARRHLKKARELAQLTGSARQRRRIRGLSRRIAKAA